MLKSFVYCPHCTNALTEVEDEGDVYMGCKRCAFIHYDNPVPVVAMVIPMIHTFLLASGMPTEGITNGGLVIVQRDRPPFKGGWCLPGGFIKRHGHPKAEGVREANEECGLLTRIEQILCACNPAPGEVNQMVISYLARPVGGTLLAGSDAAAVRVVSRDDRPVLCFGSHQRLADLWFDGKLGSLTGRDLEL